MVGHQYIGVDFTAGFIRIFFEPFKVRKIIFVGIKAGLAVIAALYDVLRNVGQDNAGAARHDRLQLNQKQVPNGSIKSWSVPYCYGGTSPIICYFTLRLLTPNEVFFNHSVVALQS